MRMNAPSKFSVFTAAFAAAVISSTAQAKMVSMETCMTEISQAWYCFVVRGTSTSSQVSCVNVTLHATVDYAVSWTQSEGWSCDRKVTPLKLWQADELL